MRILLMVLVWMGNVSAGEVYKWTDAQGHVHFGDRPPDAAAARLQEVPVAPASLPPVGLRPGERALLERAQRAEQSRLRARQASAQDSAREQSRRSNRNEYCFRSNLILQKHQDERRQGCSPRRCVNLDRHIAYYESLVRQRCP